MQYIVHLHRTQARDLQHCLQKLLAAHCFHVYGGLMRYEHTVELSQGTAFGLGARSFTQPGSIERCNQRLDAKPGSRHW